MSMSQKKSEPDVHPGERRVSTPPPEGTDPHPDAEPDRHGDGENDERLRGEKPPHY